MMKKRKAPYGPLRPIQYFYWDAEDEMTIDAHGYLIAGWFATIKPSARTVLCPLNWFHCRDVFHDFSYGLKRMLFVHKPGVGRNIAEFVRIVERKVHARPYTRLGPTQDPKVTWVQLSDWWMRHHMRRSFFTAMLRAAQRYDPDKRNFEEALWSNRYLRNNKYAARYFLDGHTKYTGNISGWNVQFFWGGEVYKRKTPSPREVRRLLVRP